MSESPSPAVEPERPLDRLTVGRIMAQVSERRASGVFDHMDGNGAVRWIIDHLLQLLDEPRTR